MLHHPALRRLPGYGFFLVAGLAATLLFYSYLKTGHYATPAWRLAQILSFWLGGIGMLWFYRWRYFLFTILALTSARGYAILSGQPGHHSLFALQFGMAAGLAVLHLYQKRHTIRLASNSTSGGAASVGTAPEFLPGMLWLFIGLLLALMMRNFYVYFGPTVLEGVWQDREVANGVSANYAWHLGAHIALNLLGPALFVFADRLWTGRHHQDLFRQVIQALSLAFWIQYLAISLEYIGFERLTAGAGDHWRIAGRLPGLFTDSGASGVMLPVLWLVAAWRLVARPKRPIANALQTWLENRQIKIAVLQGLAVVLMVLIWFQLAHIQGRMFVLSTVNLCFALFIGLFLLRRQLYPDRKTLRQVWRSRWNTRQLAGGAGLALIGAGLLCWLLLETPVTALLKTQATTLMSHILVGNWSLAFQDLDPVRSAYYTAGWHLFRAAHWSGWGLGSFMVYSRPWLPATIPLDNPGGLWIGLLSDLGLCGVLCAALFLLRGLQKLRLQWRLESVPGRMGTPVASQSGWQISDAWLYVVCIAGLIGPAFFGYHILYAEYCSLLVFLAALGRIEPDPDTI
ncbi:MAG: hypothetical protein KDK39_08205 [Leptospiraceae bacterium]|nr:hypothetical protein [Leptospiraceae bacterium]